MSVNPIAAPRQIPVASRVPADRRRLADRFNDFLLASGDAGADAVRRLERAGREDGRLHTYNRSPLLNRPGVLDAADVTALQRDLSTLLRLLTSLPERRFDGRVDEMCDALGIAGTAKRAVIETAEDRSVLLARADVVRTTDGPRAIEFNVHSSLGGMDIGSLNQTFAQLPVFRDFLARERLGYRDPLDGILDEVLRAATERGFGASPTVALVDWPTTYPVYEPVLERVCALMRAHGVDAVHTHLGRLGNRNGALWADGRRIDVLYRIFMLEDIPEQPDLVLPILEAHRAGSVLLAMSFFAELVGNKAALALLSDPGPADQLTPAERGAVDRILPPTRLLRPGTTTWDGTTVDVEKMATRRRRELVLKPAIGHGTLGVVPGWAVSAPTWRAALDQARHGVFVVQERAVAEPERIPVPGPEGWEIRDYDVNWGVFVHRDRFAGAMLRALPSGQSSVISLGAGGAVGCAFSAEPAEVGHGE